MRLPVTCLVGELLLCGGIGETNYVKILLPFQFHAADVGHKRKPLRERPRGNWSNAFHVGETIPRLFTRTGLELKLEDGHRPSKPMFAADNGLYRELICRRMLRKY